MAQIPLNKCSLLKKKLKWEYDEVCREAQLCEEHSVCTAERRHQHLSSPRIAHHLLSGGVRRAVSIGVTQQQGGARWGVGQEDGRGGEGWGVGA